MKQHHYAPIGRALNPKPPKTKLGTTLRARELSGQRTRASDGNISMGPLLLMLQLSIVLACSHAIAETSGVPGIRMVNASTLGNVLVRSPVSLLQEKGYAGLFGHGSNPLSSLGPFSCRFRADLSRRQTDAGYSLLSTDQGPSGTYPLEGEPGCRVLHDIGRAAKTLLIETTHIYTSPVRLNARSALWLGGILMVGGVVYAYDQEIYDAFHRNKNQELYKHIRRLGERIERVGYMGKTNRYYFGALLFGYIFSIESITIISAEILESHFVAGGLKNAANIVIGRRRPHQGLGPRSFEYNDGTSFPSGHSSNAYQLATVLSRHVDFLPFQVAVYSLATTICLQRITSDGHWPSDVYFGAVLGTVVSREILNLHQKGKATLNPVLSEKGAGIGLTLSFRF